VNIYKLVVPDTVEDRILMASQLILEVIQRFTIFYSFKRRNGHSPRLP